MILQARMQDQDQCELMTIFCYDLLTTDTIPDILRQNNLNKSIN